VLIVAALSTIILPIMIHSYAVRASSTSSLPWYKQPIHDNLFHQSQQLGDNGGLGRFARDDNPLEMAQFAYGERSYPSSFIVPTALAGAADQASGNRENDQGLHWRQLGPTTLNNGNYFPEPVSGRTLAIAVDPQNTQIIYIGAAQGGVWKTTDGGQHWRALTDFAPSLAVNAIAIDAKNPNILFAGTGEDNLACDAYQGAGILRSDDGGNSWTQLGTSIFLGSAIGNVLLDPRFEGHAQTEHLIIGAGYTGRSNSSTYSCDNSRPAGQNPVFGVFTSSDGGATFTETLSGGSFQGIPQQLGISDLAMSPTNPNILYAAEQVEGIFQSTDAGQHWINLDANASSGLPAPESGFDRIQLAIAPSNTQVLYSVYSNQVFTNKHLQAFKTTNGGATWTNLSSVPDVCDAQCWYDMPIAVSPIDANTVFIGGNANYDYIFNVLGTPPTPQQADCATISALSNLPTNCTAALVKSSDGGTTWQDIELGAVQTTGSRAGFPAGPFTLHPDQHAITFDPQHPQVMYIGDDGGVYVTSDGGRTWGDLNPGLATLQYQGISVSPNGQLFGGTQDNGTEKFTPQTKRVWTSVDGGDSGLTAVDPANPTTIYHTYAGDSSLVRSDDDGATWNLIDAPFFLQDSASFYPAFGLAPTHSATLYYGTYRVWRTDDRGGPVNSAGTGHWTAISGDLTNTAGACAFACISAVAISPVDPNVVVIGTGGGLLWQSTNADSAHPTWTQINGANTPNRFITEIVFASGSSTTVYVTYSGFNTTVGSSTSGHLLVSTTIGSAMPSFTEIDGQNRPEAIHAHANIPDLPTNSVMVDPQDPTILFVAADFGVYVTTNSGQTWNRIDSNLPHVQGYLLAFDPTTNSMVLATHGRGVWSLPLDDVRGQQFG
jgi:photosystem II stability/assembly factor-like uncharacterized protein